MAQTAEDVHSPAFLAGDAVRIAADGKPRLIGCACRDCSLKAFPPVAVCSDCMSENIDEIELSDTGTLYAYSVVHVAPAGWDVPYIAGYVDLPEGVRVFTHVTNTDPDSLRMDCPVSLTLAVLGTDENGDAIESYAFEPVTGETGAS